MTETNAAGPTVDVSVTAVLNPDEVAVTVDVVGVGRAQVIR